MYKWVGVEIVSHIPISISFSSSSANNLEVFFMFPQAKRKQEGKARSLTPQADTNCQPYELNQDI
jgi:hypothetical protein